MSLLNALADFAGICIVSTTRDGSDEVVVYFLVGYFVVIKVVGF